MHKSDAERRRGFKELIETFLQERLEGKVKGDAEEDAVLSARYQPEKWIADAARRVKKIQAATHVLKATHPGAKGSSMYCIPDSSGRQHLVGSHQLFESFTTDIALEDAKHLDICAFLFCEYEGRSLLAWMQEGDEDLLDALHADPAHAKQWTAAFTSLIRQVEAPASHTYAKQLYWLVGDDPASDTHYHLLSPLHPSSLTHKIFEVIDEDRFGEGVKETRQAKKDNFYSKQILHEYPNLVVQKLGGDHPKNISFLTKKHKGVNYLLASLPPIWKSRDVRPPWGTRPLFEQFGDRRDCARLVARLKEFLESDPAPTLETREHRDDLLDQIIGEVQQYADELRTLEPGWSTDSRCRLVEAEALWLDPGRAALDAAFAKAWMQGHWKAAVQHRFADWLNQALGEKLPLGVIEHAFWADALATEDWQRQIDADRRALKKKGASHA